MWSSLEKLKEKRQSLSHLLRNLDWEETREDVNRESRARILLLGLPEAGKSSLLNRLCGWPVSSPTGQPDPGNSPNGGPVEDFGLFCLVDLPPDMGRHTNLPVLDILPPNGFGYGFDSGGANLSMDWQEALPLDALDPLELAHGADLLVYVLDGSQEIGAIDYRWVGRLRRLGVPLLVVLNKMDLITDNLPARQAQIEARLATSVLPVSALHGTNIVERLLPKMSGMCPSLTMALGRELHGYRRHAARRLIHQSAFINGIVALEPVPLVDLPIQVMTLTRLMLQLAAIYDRPPDKMRKREVVAAVAGGLAGRFTAQQLAKLVPVIGWLISGAIGWACTWGLGRATVAYFEAGGDDTVARSLAQTKTGLLNFPRSLYNRWQQRSRFKLGRRLGTKSLPHSDEENGDEEQGAK